MMTITLPSWIVYTVLAYYTILLVLKLIQVPLEARRLHYTKKLAELTQRRTK